MTDLATDDLLYAYGTPACDVEMIADDDAGDDPWAAPSWREATLDYHSDRARYRRASDVSYAPEEVARLRRLMDDNVSLDRAWLDLNGRRSGAAASTVEAMMYSLRERGMQALGEPDVLRRLAQIDDTQLHEVATRLQKLEPHIASAWSQEDVQVLLTVRSEIP
jgi:hypothetical protein